MLSDERNYGDVWDLENIDPITNKRTMSEDSSKTESVFSHEDPIEILSDHDESEQREIVQTAAEEKTDQPPPDKPRRRRKLAHLQEIADPQEFDEVSLSSKIYTSKVSVFQKVASDLRTQNSIPKNLMMEAGDDADEPVTKRTTSSDVKSSPPPSNEKDSGIVTIDDDDDSIAIHSSPPPQSRCQRNTKRSRKTNLVLKKLMQAESAYKLTNPKPLSFLEEPEDVLLIDAERPKEISLKIRWKTSIFKFPIDTNKTVYTIYPKLAEMCNCSPSEILLTHNETMVNPEKTPNELQITIADIFDCYVMAAAQKGGDAEEVQSSIHSIRLQVQSQNAKHRTSITIKKTDPMSMLMSKYANVCGIPESNLHFYFDGDLIEPSDTPLDLDLENDCCIDVKMKKL